MRSKSEVLKKRMEEGYKESNEENVKIAEEMKEYMGEIVDDEPWQKALEMIKDNFYDVTEIWTLKNYLSGYDFWKNVEKALKLCQRETEKKFIEKCNKSKIWDNLGFIKGTKLHDYVKNLEKGIGELEGEKELSEHENIRIKELKQTIKQLKQQLKEYKEIVEQVEKGEYIPEIFIDDLNELRKLLAIAGSSSPACDRCNVIFEEDCKKLKCPYFVDNKGDVNERRDKEESAGKVN